MSRWLKLLIGLAVSLLVAWLAYGPLGQGNAYIDKLQQRADAVLRYTEIPNLQARMSRAPLARTVFLCGPTNDFQRDGTMNWSKAADFPGVDALMLYAGGIGRVVWDPAPPSPRAATPACPPGGPGTGSGAGLPLVAEWLGLAFLFWLIGLGIGWLFFRPRPPRTGYLS
ncbi:MAG TPA: hypothetical protein VMG08_18805 [Allosphingosinicella sp.]|nr:hypothetical protein [Allosphingosinicella sp.]